jgi:hypothetical protein
MLEILAILDKLDILHIVGHVGHNGNSGHTGHTSTVDMLVNLNMADRLYILDILERYTSHSDILDTLVILDPGYWSFSSFSSFWSFWTYWTNTLWTFGHLDT